MKRTYDTIATYLKQLVSAVAHSFAIQLAIAVAPAVIALFATFFTNFILTMENNKPQKQLSALGGSAILSLVIFALLLISLGVNIYLMVSNSKKDKIIADQNEKLLTGVMDAAKNNPTSSQTSTQTTE